MLKTLAWKETREMLPLVALAWGGTLLLFLAAARSIAPVAEPRAIPFVSSSLPSMLLLIGAIFGTAVGFWQTLTETGRGTFLFLLHRPIERSYIFKLKLLVGISLTLLVVGLPMLIYALWAATPGTHASPFFWAMSVSAWLGWLRLPLFYLGAFLSGLREARWWGSRALPLLAAFGIYMILFGLEQWPVLLTALSLAVLTCYVVVIRSVAATRDYS
jgi:ABC-type transport system involved in multi-copper enzyme maturation permease subunit